jgi:hypothetical protein
MTLGQNVQHTILLCDEQQPHVYSVYSGVHNMHSTRYSDWYSRCCSCGLFVNTINDDATRVIVIVVTVVSTTYIKAKVKQATL